MVECDSMRFDKRQRKRVTQMKLEYDFYIPDSVREVMARLSENGERAYIVGGSLRDSLLLKKPHDFDLASSAEPLRVCEIFSDKRVIKTGLAHGTVTVIVGGEPIEITTFRVDGEYLDMRRPESVSFTRRIEDDLSRRDFTVNALAYNDSEGLVDLFGGREDLENKIIRTVGDPRLRFSEDALRIMRAFRFSAQLGFTIEEETLLAAGSLANRLSFIAKERIFSELVKLICSPYPEKSLMQMKELSALSYVLFEYSPSERAISLLSKVENDDISRLSALFSDADGYIARSVLTRLKASSRQRSAVAAVVDASKLSYSSREDVTRLRSRLGDDFAIALKLSVLLGSSSEDILGYLNDNTPCSISELAIDGSDLMALGYEGREIGKALALLLDAVVKDPSLNSRDRLVELLGSLF